MMLFGLDWYVGMWDPHGHYMWVITSGKKSSRFDQKSPWPKIDQNGQNWPKMVQNCPKWPEFSKIQHTSNPLAFRDKMVQDSPYVTKKPKIAQNDTNGPSSPNIEDLVSCCYHI